MYYIAETDKSFEQAASDLDTAVKRNGFGVLHVHDLGGTLRSKGIDFPEQCKTKIGLIRPAQMISSLSQDASLSQVAGEVESKTIQMIDEAK